MIFNKNKIKKALFSSTIMATSMTTSMAFAIPVALNITITGQGSVTVTGQESCTTDCILMIEQGQQFDVLTSASSGWQQGPWNSNECDGGTGVVNDTPAAMINSTRTHFLAEAKYADFNGDRLPDILLSEGIPKASVTEPSLTSLDDFESFKISVLMNGSSGSFVPTEELLVLGLDYGWTGLETADWDKDGDIDILIASHSKRDISLFVNDGNGQFTAGDIFASPENISPYRVKVADINDDGYQDLLITAFDYSGVSNDRLAWYINDGSDNFSLYKTIAENDSIISIDVADVDKDGDLDVVVASDRKSEGRIYYNEANNFSLASSTRLYSALSGNVSFGDLDNNGTLDVAYANLRSGIIGFVAQNSDGTFLPLETLYVNPDYGDSPAFVDIDDDGKLDVASSGSTGIFWQKITEYKGCNIQMQQARSLTVTFERKTEATTVPEPTHTPEPTPVPEPTLTPEPITPPEAETTPTDNSSGGSSTVFSLLFIMLLTGLRKLRRN